MKIQFLDVADALANMTTAETIGHPHVTAVFAYSDSGMITVDDAQMVAEVKAQDITSRSVHHVAASLHRPDLIQYAKIPRSQRPKAKTKPRQHRRTRSRRLRSAYLHRFKCK